MGVIPPAQSGEFVAHIEDILDLDDQPVQLLQETRQPLPAAPGQPEKVDDEYERNGTANIFLVTEPLRGTRHGQVTEHSTAVDWATELRDLREGRDLEAARVRLVCDNLNTPGRGSLDETFLPDQAHRLAARLEIHPTPKPGRWLKIAEIERSGLTRQCLACRLPDLETLTQATQQWAQRRNATQKGVDWQCSTLEARIQLKRLYPQIQN
jgi:hypothetical protein